jgi:hypothetical protein
MTDTKPKLYSKGVIITFSLLLSTFFGALLFAFNLMEAGKKKGVMNVILFSIVWNFLLIRVLVKVIHNTLINFGIINLSGGLIIAFIFWKIYLKEVVEFERKDIRLPLILLIVIYGALIAFLLISQYSL